MRILPQRRKDLEREFHRKFEPWLTAWEWRRAIWVVAVILHPAFWSHLRKMWGDGWPRAFWFWLKTPVHIWWRQ